ncbi:MAG TPA: hypothetical protein VLB73_00495 [Patescibacteria group bacterium]|nr:hypothetical protein [Patescibacteria group bacterium]
MATPSLREGIEQTIRSGDDPANSSYGPVKPHAPVFPTFQVRRNDQDGTRDPHDPSNITDEQNGYRRNTTEQPRNRPARGRGY